jgi:large subunit ribosomal protein L21
MKAYAVVQTGGKQYRVSEGDVVDVELLPQAAGETVTLDQVLAVSNGDSLTVGKPTVSGASVTATVVKHFRDKKVVSYKKKRRKGYKRKQGHRQELTQIQITKVA